MKPWLTSGLKFGDMCSVLALAQDEFIRTGENPTLITNKGMLPLLDGVSYVNSIVYPGEWNDLKGALLWAKKKYGEVKCLSFHGKNWPVHKKTCSFQLDIYERGGQLTRFPLPLVFDNRNPEREKVLIDKYCGFARGTILVADHSESSPFGKIDDLIILLESSFPEYQINRLSQTKAVKPYDLIGLYENTLCLVSIDTMHLHLSAASKVPVIALTTVKPEYWHGTAYQERFKCHIRYNDYDDRKGDIVDAIQSLIDGTSRPKPVIYETEHPHGYNPSIIEFEGRQISTYRYHPDPKFWRTQLALVDSGKTYSIQPPVGFEEHSLEDGRLFIFKDKLHISYVVACAPENVFRCAMQYGELEKTESGWRIINNYQPAYGTNDLIGLQKNWLFYSIGERLFCTYAHAAEHHVLELNRDIVVNEFKSVTPICPFGIPRGGTQPLDYDGKWLRFFHVQENKYNDRTRAKYHIGCLVMDKEPPFKILKIRQKPILSGNEKYFSNWKFWKWNVAIPYGAIPDGDGWLVSVGLNDSACSVVRFTKEDLNL